MHPQPVPRYLEHLSEVVIETIKALSSNHQAITPVILSQALHTRGSLASMEGLWRREQVPVVTDDGRRIDGDPPSGGPCEGNCVKGACLGSMKEFCIGVLSLMVEGIPDDNSRKSLKVMETIRELSTPLDLPALLDEVRRDMGPQIRRIEEDLRSYAQLLVGMGKELIVIESCLASSSQCAKDVLTTNCQFGGILERRLDGLADSATSPEVLSELSSCLSAKLSEIKELLGKKKHLDTVQFDKLSGELQSLKGRIRSMKDEIDSVQEKAKTLEQENLIDPLTGVHNRRAFDRRFEEMMRRGDDAKGAFGLLVVDIDRFKDVNDTYGHKAGDRCLQELGKIIEQCLRTSDTVARYGGEEFAVILPGVNEEGLRLVGERIRATIERCRFVYRNKPIPITVSVGATLREPSEADGETLFNRADGALYKAKQTGRNRMVVV